MIWIILLTILSVILQISSFSILGLGFIALQPLTLLLATLFFFEEENFLFWSMLIGGLLFDIFSTRAFGNFLLIYLSFFVLGIVYSYTTEKLAKIIRSSAFAATIALISTFISLFWQTYPFWSNLGISILNSLFNTVIFLILLKLINRYLIDERRI